jgi:hypothetical protein
LDERVSRALTELKRAGISPLEFALATIDPRDVESLGSILVTQATKLATTPQAPASGTKERVWTVLQEYIKALASVLEKEKPAPQYPGLVHFDGYFLQTQEKYETHFRNAVRSSLTPSQS